MGTAVRKCKAEGPCLFILLCLSTKASHFCFPSVFFTLQTCFASCATAIKGYPTAPRVLCSQFKRTVESEHLAELVSCTCLVQVTTPGGHGGARLCPRLSHLREGTLRGRGWCVGGDLGPPSPAGRAISLGI